MNHRPLLAALCGLSCFLAIALSDTSANAAEFAPAPADTPRVADGLSPIGPLRRGANGEIEVVDPTKEVGSGPRLCSAGTICVGKDQAYQTLSAALGVARKGDVIEIGGGTYRETAVLATSDLTIRGVGGRPHFDCDGLRISGDKGCLVIAAPGITLENLEISGAVVSETLGANGACIRGEADATFTLRGIICHGSQDGILATSRTMVIENSEFYDNGWTGLTHNVYFSIGCDSVIVRGSTFRDARVGHEFKSRCQRTEISDSIFRSTIGSRDLDIPDGGDTIVYRSTLVKTMGTQNEDIVGFAAESCRYPASMQLKDVRIVNSRQDAVIHNFDKCKGHPIVLEGVTIEGTPPREIGYILKR